jgi:hypothetical protein
MCWAIFQSTHRVLTSCTVLGRASTIRQYALTGGSAPGIWSDEMGGLYKTSTNLSLLVPYLVLRNRTSLSNMGQRRQQPQQRHNQRGEKACSAKVLLLIFLVRIADPQHGNPTQSNQTDPAGSYTGISHVATPADNLIQPGQQLGEGARSVAVFPLTAPTGQRTHPTTINHRAT